MTGSLVATSGSGSGPSLKTLSSSLGQLIWALNSNKEHIKYVAKVCALPESYESRNGVGSGGSLAFGFADESLGSSNVQLKVKIAEMVSLAEEAIARAQELKDLFHEVIVAVFLKMASGVEDGEENAQD